MGSDLSRHHCILPPHGVDDSTVFFSFPVPTVASATFSSISSVFLAWHCAPSRLSSLFSVFLARYCALPLLGSCASFVFLDGEVRHRILTACEEFLVIVGEFSVLAMCIPCCSSIMDVLGKRLDTCEHDYLLVPRPSFHRIKMSCTMLHPLVFPLDRVEKDFRVLPESWNDAWWYVARVRDSCIYLLLLARAFFFGGYRFPIMKWFRHWKLFGISVGDTFLKVTHFRRFILKSDNIFMRDPYAIPREHYISVVACVADSRRHHGAENRDYAIRYEQP